MDQHSYCLFTSFGDLQTYYIHFKMNPFEVTEKQLVGVRVEVHAASKIKLRSSKIPPPPFLK